MEAVMELPVALKTKVRCIQEHPDGNFTVDRVYTVGSYRELGKYMGVRVRDDRRQRKDFNFLETSKNYFWDYFKREE